MRKILRYFNNNDARNNNSNDITVINNIKIEGQRCVYGPLIRCYEHPLQSKYIRIVMG